MLYLPDKVIAVTKAFGFFIIAASMLAAYAGLLWVALIAIFNSILS